MKVSQEIVVDAEQCMRKMLQDMLEDGTQVSLRVSGIILMLMRT